MIGDRREDLIVLYYDSASSGRKNSQYGGKYKRFQMCSKSRHACSSGQVEDELQTRQLFKFSFLYDGCLQEDDYRTRDVKLSSCPTMCAVIGTIYVNHGHLP
jgi:hypothetical protein